MDNGFNETEDRNVNAESPKSEQTAISRVKRMRGWLGTTSSTAFHSHADNNEPLLPGEGHSGWNR